MFDIRELIRRTKLTDRPTVFAGTPVRLEDPAKALFPYPNHWRGDFRSACPRVECRTAGWRGRIDYDFVQPIEPDYYSPSYCFETAPGTLFPCWSFTSPCVIPYAAV